MKITFKKKEGIDLYEVFQNGIKTKWSISKNQWGSGCYYALKYGKSFRGKFSSMEEVQDYLRVKILDDLASKMI